MLDRSSLTIVQTFLHPCHRSNTSVSESVLEVHDGSAHLKLAQYVVSYIYVKGQAHNCCEGNRCLTLRPRAQSPGATASGPYGTVATALSTRPSCGTVKSTIPGTAGFIPAHVSPTSSSSRHTIGVSATSGPTASGVAVPSSPSSGASGGHGHVSPAVDNAAAVMYGPAPFIAVTLALLALLTL